MHKSRLLQKSYGKDMRQHCWLKESSKQGLSTISSSKIRQPWTCLILQRTFLQSSYSGTNLLRKTVLGPRKNYQYLHQPSCGRYINDRSTVGPVIFERSKKSGIASWGLHSKDEATTGHESFATKKQNKSPSWGMSTAKEDNDKSNSAGINSKPSAPVWGLPSRDKAIIGHESLATKKQNESPSWGLSLNRGASFESLSYRAKNEARTPNQGSFLHSETSSTKIQSDQARVPGSKISSVSPSLDERSKMASLSHSFNTSKPYRKFGLKESVRSQITPKNTYAEHDRSCQSFVKESSLSSWSSSRGDTTSISQKFSRKALDSAGILHREGNNYMHHENERVNKSSEGSIQHENSLVSDENTRRSDISLNPGGRVEIENMLNPLNPGIYFNENSEFEESRAMRERNAQFGNYIPLRQQQENRENENQPNNLPQSREITDLKNREIFPLLNGTRESEPTKYQITENRNKDVRMINFTDTRLDKFKNNYDIEEDKKVELSQQTCNTSEESGFDKTQEPKYIEKSPRSTLEQASNTSDVEGKYQPKSSSRSIDLSLSTRPRREKKKRGLENKPKFEDERPKIFGKDKDKARREAKFSRSEEEEIEVQKILEQKLERQRIRAEKRAARKTSITPLLLPQYITIANLAVAMRIRYEELATKMKELGYEDTHSNVILNAENSTLIAMEYSFEPMIERDDSEDLKAREPHPNPSELPRRPPIVTIMGHVDHGKTTLLDFLRKSSVAANEFGGITQHIGAFSVPMPGGKIITFLDTPGHAAFLSMRQRGANVTDIVVLVVASDDSVKPQTIEAINHAKAAQVPMIVAINKIDKPESDPEKVKLDLARYGVEIEDFGGDTQVVCVSGKTGKGMNELEETISALSEILDLQAEATGPIEGWVLEASIKSQGKVATILIRRGTLRSGDIVVAGDTWAKVRILRNEFGTELVEAGPGTPVEVDGWREQPLAGDEVLQAENEAVAKRAVVYRLEKKQLDRLAADIEVINAVRDETRNLRKLVKAARDEAIEEKNAGKGWKFVSPQRQEKTDGPKKVPFVIKADVSGSLEAVLDQVNMLSSKEVEPNVIRSGVGPVSEFDVSHASAASGYIINFNSAIEPHIARLAAESGVKIIDSKVIYALIEAVKAELSELLTPIVTKTVVGEAEISMIFSINLKNRKPEIVAGCKVVNGSIKKTGKVRVLRSDDVIFDGELSSLKVLKRSVQEVDIGKECGVVFKDWTEFKPGDHIQQYDEIYQKRYL
ncbi:unnamed protein product [Blumeria hordei]|uniref:Translation initiation factor IF-2, mitochondrial n=1 Tax=Blumeria hordei TaxID=2867405 RepID=A0A383UQK7_BLUHO|nr:unnamed protein product [Blumeria hordei]